MARWAVFAQDEAEAAAGWQDKLQAVNDKVPELLGKLGLPVLDEPPVLDIVTDFAIILGGIALLIALWRLLTLRVFRAFFAFVAAVLILYYPVAYGAHWWLFEYDRAAKLERTPEEIPNWETQVKDNLRWVDYGIMAAGVFLGGTLLLVSRPGKERYEDEEEEEAQQQRRPSSEAPWHQPPEKPSRRRSGGGGKPEKNPFDFS